MKRVAILLAAMAVAGPVQAADANQFDLVCKMTSVMTAYLRDGSQLREPTRLELAEIRYSIDLTAKEWCPVSNCAERGTQSIQEVTSTTIILERQGLRDNFINRVDGTITFHSEMPASGGRIVTIMSGPCRKAEFTPRPTTQF